MSDYASCCLLSYERPAFLRTAIETLLANAESPLELIVHDDGSTNPGVRAVLLEALDAGRVSTVILNPAGWNSGQGTALNRMFNMATGDPIIKCDQDLIFHPGWLRKMLEILAANREEVDVCADPIWGARIGLLGAFHYHHDPVDSAKTKIAQHDGWQEHSHLCGSAFAVTRDCWRALGPFNEGSAAFAEDWEFQRLVTESGRFVCGLPNEDLVTNQGFGIGAELSTVVVAPGQVHPIHMGPVIHGA